MSIGGDKPIDMIRRALVDIPNKPTTFVSWSQTMLLRITVLYRVIIEIIFIVNDLNAFLLTSSSIIDRHQITRYYPIPTLSSAERGQCVEADLR